MRNRSARPCDLYGHPRVEPLNVHRQPIAFIRRILPGTTLRRHVALPARETPRHVTAWFGYAAYSGSIFAPPCGRSPVITYLRFTLRGQTLLVHLDPDVQLSLCGRSPRFFTGAFG